MNPWDNYQEEMRSAYLYRAIAQFETTEEHKKLFQGLSSLAEKQAEIWKKQCQPAPPAFKPDIRTKLVIMLVRCFGVRSLRIVLAAMKIRGMSVYGSDMVHTGLTHSPEMENRHRSVSNGNNLRAAVFGINDGLISNASLIFAIVGAHAGQNIIFLTGIAGLLAGACSMGAGEYISVRSQREMLEYQLKLEKNELELYPEEEAQELSLIYQARGVPAAEADKVAHILIQNPEKALDTLAREELGINPDDLVSPIGAMLSSFFSFAIGAFIPVMPFVFSNNPLTVFFSIFLTAIALFMVGAVMSIFTQRSVILSGLRMLVIGALAGVLTFGIGSLLGVQSL